MSKTKPQFVTIDTSLFTIGQAVVFGDGNKFIPSDGSTLLTGYTVATLPIGTVGDTAYVTDADTPAYGATVVGGGVTTIPVFYDGTNWICH